MENKNFVLYQNLDKLDVAKLTEAAGSSTWPKGKRYSVNLGGKEFRIQTYFSRAADNEPKSGYDAYEAINSLRAKEIPPEDIMWETNGEPQFTDPEFDTSVLKNLSPEQIKQRNSFITAVANLINNQETMEAIVKAATKKKNGTLHKNRLVRIASSGVALIFHDIYAIVGRAKSDYSISVTFETVRCSPGDNEVWANDFISTYHEGLPVSEALKSALG